MYARVSGYLVELHVDRGDRVKAGQLLGRVTTPETELQLLPLIASYNARKAVADRLRPLVPKGVVAHIDLERADADAQAAKSDVDRLGALRSFDMIRAPFDGIITQRYVDIGALMPAPTGATQAAQPLVDIAGYDARARGDLRRPARRDGHPARRCALGRARRGSAASRSPAR